MTPWEGRLDKAYPVSSRESVDGQSRKRCDRIDHAVPREMLRETNMTSWTRVLCCILDPTLNCQCISYRSMG
jgi:hypothetical protein